MVASTSSLLIITKSGAEDEGPKGHQQSEGGMKYTQNTAERQRLFFLFSFSLLLKVGYSQSVFSRPSCQITILNDRAKKQISYKVEKILKGSLNSIQSPSPSVKIQIKGGKVCLRCKGKT